MLSILTLLLLLCWNKSKYNTAYESCLLEFLLKYITIIRLISRYEYSIFFHHRFFYITAFKICYIKYFKTPSVVFVSICVLQKGFNIFSYARSRFVIRWSSCKKKITGIDVMAQYSLNSARGYVYYVLRYHFNDNWLLYKFSNLLFIMFYIVYDT